ncbi:MICOS complex subunit Mic10 [Drosophila grimshawi]|uniref:MICOS complex subunit MIC10 n=1 Tax=Drosophila grimshawi TaxID=7222 RepID=B4JWV9_DROGR|nr:MICOS complex subunit Mic10 [Drosophila grimshawi]EDV95235.1 GH17826 [Drosophila grimshawi]
MPVDDKSFMEEQPGKMFDRCLANGIIKGGGGLIIGTVISLLFLRRRVWPMLIGTGFGIGVAYNACEKDLKSIK